MEALTCRLVGGFVGKARSSGCPLSPRLSPFPPFSPVVPISPVLWEELSRKVATDWHGLQRI